MTKIVHKNLPNSVSVSDVSDATVRQKLMLANQNIAVLMSQLSEAQKAIVELQRRTGMSVSLGGSTAEVKTVVNATLQEKGIQDGAEPNVQSDWTQVDTMADDYVKNKPQLATVATSGSYNDLSDKPTIPTGQVNADWNATEGLAKILNKPTTMKNPYALSMTPIDASGASGSVVQYDGSSGKSLNVLIAHQDISGKISYPSGGSNGNVLTKNGTSASWSSLTVISFTTRTFSGSTSVSASSSPTVNVDVGLNGYTPLIISHVGCNITSISSPEWLKNMCRCVSSSLSNNTASIKFGSLDGQTSSKTVSYSFVVLYKSN